MEKVKRNLDGREKKNFVSSFGFGLSITCSFFWWRLVCVADRHIEMSRETLHSLVSRNEKIRSQTLMFTSRTFWNQKKKTNTIFFLDEEVAERNK